MERLLDYFTPERYWLDLDINKHTEAVHGRVRVAGRQHAPVVKLHAEGMTIDRVRVGGEIVRFEHGGGILSLPPMGPHRGVVEIEVDFHYKLGRNMQGVYLSTYPGENGEERVVATQFESHYARQAFPCVDEPAAKAVFELTLRVPDEGEVVVANTERMERGEATEVFAGARQAETSGGAGAFVEAEISMKVRGAVAEGSAEAPGGGVEKSGRVVTFAPTPKMSTYLLAFCIGQFRHKSVTSKHGVTVTTYCTPNHPAEALDFANEIATAALDFYDDLFGIKYPLDKLDQVALPDFEAGAMENWGLVTYRESCLLADPASTGQDSKEYIATVIAHELSHQWFGDLVTMAWWDDLWLNESFATVMEYYCVDAIHPEYQIWESFFTGDCLAALGRDCLPGVQAVQQPVQDPAEIPTLFDGAIVYAKGARLMLMLMRLMTPRRFFAGIKEYFREHQYGNTVGDDLWRALQAHADFDVKEFMHSWIARPGYPVITDGVQQRFLLTGTDDGTDFDGAGWDGKSRGDSGEAHGGGSADFDGGADFNGVSGAGDWPIPEVKDDMSGHYLINLSGPEFQEALAKFDRLSLEQRLRLLIDRNLLSKTSLVSSASLLDIVPKFAKEASEPVWSVLSTILSGLRVFCPEFEDSGSDVRGRGSDLTKMQKNVIKSKAGSSELPEESEYSILYKKFVRKSISTQYSLLSVKEKKGESANDTKLRPTILSWAIFAENPADLAEIAELYRPDLEKIDPNTRAAALRAHYRTSGEADFGNFLAQYQATAAPDLKADLRATLAGSRKAEHVRAGIDLLKNPEIVKPQDHLYLYVGLLRNPYARVVALDWIYANWEYVRQMTGDKSLEDYPRVIAGALRTQAEADRFFEFFGRMRNEPALRRTIEVAEPQVQATLRLLKMDTGAVRGRLREG